MKKNIAAKISALALAFACSVAPATALAAPAPASTVTFNPYAAAYADDVTDDDLSGCYFFFSDELDYNTSWSTPREQLRALAVSLRDAGLKPSEVYGVEVLSYLQYGRRLIDVEFWAYGTCFDYTVDAATGFILDVNVF